MIGAGYMGRLHAAKIAAREDCVLAAVVDPEPERAAALAQAHGGRAFADLREAVALVDAAVVCAPTERHLPLAGALLEAGRHVLVEKPMASSVEEAERLIALAARHGAVLQVGHVERYNRAFRALKSRMTRPAFIDAERLSGFKQRGADVDVVRDLMIHDLDLALALAGAAVESVSACGFRVLTGDIDIANSRIEFANGAVASLSASRVSQAPIRKLRVFQPDLYVSADLQAGGLRYVRRAGNAIEETEERHEGGDALAAQIAAFVDAVRGRGPVEVTGEDGRRSLELALEIGRRVRERLERFA